MQAAILWWYIVRARDKVFGGHQRETARKQDGRRHEKRRNEQTHSSSEPLLEGDNVRGDGRIAVISAANATQLACGLDTEATSEPTQQR
eukprot:2257058-Lingulodinium_polyedra.AAC.1